MERNQSFCYCLLALAFIISIVSLVLNIVILSKPNILQSERDRSQESLPEESPVGETQIMESEPPTSNEKPYVFGYDVPWDEYQYITNDGELRGLSIDIVDAVCKEARKTCHHIVIPIEYCWDTEKGTGSGLFGKWVDACAVFLKTSSRDNSFRFSGRFYKPKMGVFYSKDSIEIDDLSELVVGVREHWYIGSSCLSKQNRQPQTVVTAVDHDELYDLLQNESVKAAFVEEGTFATKTDLIESSAKYDCSLGSSGVMHRVDSDIPSWFNPAFESVKKLGVFKSLCGKYDGAKRTCLFN